MAFWRKILVDLEQWKNQPRRKPLILRGARQVGKTTAVHLFAQQFDYYLYLNLEKADEKRLCEQSETFDEFLEAIFFVKKIPRNKGKTLIFFDEIQNSPATVARLRFFPEEAPHLYVIAAGSLLETVIDVHVHIPLGRVEYRYIYPLTFIEFLNALGEKELIERLYTTEIPDYVHRILLKLFHKYTLIGGMPETVKTYAETRDFTQIAPVYDALLTSYLDDVEKYAQSESSRRILRHCIRSSFFEAGKRIKFQGFGQSNYKSREVSKALHALEKAMLVYLIYPTTNTRLPLIPNHKKAPRLQVLDTGLLNYFVGLQEALFQTPEIDTLYEGRVAEHIAGQELLAQRRTAIQPLVFWTREKKQSTAELDYVLPFRDMAVPMEVKSGKVGKLRSLHLFMDQVAHPYAMRVYSGKFGVDHVRTFNGKPFQLINLPLYLVERWEHILDTILTSD